MHLQRAIQTWQYNQRARYDEIDWYWILICRATHREQKAKMVKLSADLAQRTELAENLKAHVVDIEDQLQERNEECKELRKEAEEQASGANDNHDKLEEMAESIRKLKEDKEEMKQKLKSTEKELQKTMAMNERDSGAKMAEEEESKLRNLLEKLQSEVESLKTELKDAQARNTELMQNQEKERSALEEMRGKWSESQKALEGLKEAAAAADAAAAEAAAAAAAAAGTISDDAGGKKSDNAIASITISQKEALEEAAAKVTKLEGEIKIL